MVGAKFGWRCAGTGCGHAMLPACFEVDHIVELADGGSDSADNMQPLCPTCHSTKTLANRIRRRAEARKKLNELQKGMPPVPKKKAVKRSRDAVDTIMDPENIFSCYSFMPLV